MRAEPVSLGAGAVLRYEAAFLSPEQASRLQAELSERVPWQQGELSFFGKKVLEPRLSAWFGDADYTYSGRRVAARPWLPALLEIRDRIELATGSRFNSVLLNLYRDGRDSMGFHADDEPELGPNPEIASVSLGAARRFLYRPKRRFEKQLSGGELVLSSGSLLWMGGTFQHVFRHAVPKTAAPLGARINLTFRWVTS
ncbi:MAG TPA: alpha-ketoglutarate-dependent dioxygenase AlkB [Polyangiaceae bacterium]|nr:alpha-ketoglutarate-dependent dioxygenase AlkB [Polyangiaceae bacterium]